MFFDLLYSYTKFKSAIETSGEKDQQQALKKRNKFIKSFKTILKTYKNIKMIFECKLNRRISYLVF